MNSPNSIKGLFPLPCPHCGVMNYAALETQIPSIQKIYSQEEIDMAKEEVMNRIRTKNLSEEILWSISQKISDKDTLFAPEDVDNVVEQLLAEV